jgi:hypothetical protein
VVWTLVPGVGIRRAQLRGGDALLTLRGLFVSFCTAIALVGVVVVVLSAGSEAVGSDLPAVPVGAAVVAAGVVLLVASAWRRPLDCASDAALGSSYRRRFFLRIAFAECGSLLGFVGFILTGNPAVYPAGAVFTVIGFALLAPTAGNLARDQEELGRTGCRRSLVTALRDVPPARR